MFRVLLADQTRVIPPRAPLQTSPRALTRRPCRADAANARLISLACPASGT